MSFRSISSFVYSSLIMMFLVPGTLLRVLISLHVPFAHIISNLFIVLMLLMTILLIIIDGNRMVNIFFILIFILTIFSLYKISSISGQPFSWRLSGYVYLLVLLTLLVFEREKNLISNSGIMWGVIVFSLVNCVIGLVQYFSQNVILPSASTLHESTIRLNSSIWFLGHTGTLRAFGFFSSGMSFGIIMVLALSVIWYEKLKIPRLLRCALLVLFVAGVIVSLTKNVYVLGILTVLLKYFPKIVKKVLFFGGVIVQLVSGLLAVLIQNSVYFQSEFFATFRIRFTGLIYFQNYYTNNLQGILFGHGFQYDTSYKNFTVLALDNQFWALFFEGGMLLVIIVYFLIYLVAFKTKYKHYCFTNILVLFGIFGVSNNFLTFFLGIAVLARLMDKNSINEQLKLPGGTENGVYKIKG